MKSTIIITQGQPTHKKIRLENKQIKTHLYCMLQVPTTQFAKMSIDLKFVELTADVLEICL